MVGTILICFILFALETSMGRWPAGSWMNKHIWNLSGEGGVNRDCGQRPRILRVLGKIG